MHCMCVTARLGSARNKLNVNDAHQTSNILPDPKRRQTHGVKKVVNETKRITCVVDRPHHAGWAARHG